MQVICEANESVLSILKRFLKRDGCTRWLHYCVQTPVDNGVLVFNTLTRELVYLSQEEYNHYTELDYLSDRWFVVPEATKEKEYADFVKLVLHTCQKKAKEITGYTIFPTTDCNARCFYCFELGRSRIPMSKETAAKVALYIEEHCGNKKVNINWFGGEPLFNIEAVETICSELHRRGIEFNSRMVSNGYLFNDDIVRKAIEQWNLKHVQITLDGTEKVYNKTKAFIYRDTNPYEIVMNNIRRLVNAEIYVSIRLNMDLYNSEDLLALAQELAQRFGGNKYLSVYAHHLFKTDIPMAEMHSDEEWEKRDVAMQRLNDCLFLNELSVKVGVSKSIKSNFCKADCGSAVTILPDGNIGLCEHFSESEFIGHIDHEGFDAETIASWKETIPEIPECADCFYFLDCVMLKKCPSGKSCYRQYRQERLRNTQYKMLCSYERWQTQAINDVEDDNDNC